MLTDVLSIGLQVENKVGAKDLNPVGIIREKFWTMLKKLALIYFDFLDHRLDEKVRPSQQKKHKIEEIAWRSQGLI